MKYWYSQPNEHLKAYVRTILTMEGAASPSDTRLPLVTNGMPVFIVRFGNNPDNGALNLQMILYGKSAPQESWKVDMKTTLIAFFFHPFVMAALFNLSAAGLVKMPLDLRNWNLNQSESLEKQLKLAVSISCRLELLEQFLLQLLHRHRKQCEVIRMATDAMLLAAGAHMLPGLLLQVQVNERTFQRMFKKYVGLSPNQYRRICQFQVSFSQVRARGFEKLTDVAYENGFADQSHFIRSFKEFTETTPNDYIRSGLKKS